MNLLVIFILTFIILLSIILFINLTLGLDYAFNQHEQKLLLTFYLFMKSVKVIQILPQNKEIKKKKLKKKKLKKKNKQAFKINDYKLLLRIIHVIRVILNRSLKIKDFRLNVKIGADDPADTAIIYGMLWTIVGAVTSYFFTRYNPKNKIINITADFNKETFNVEFNCIFSIRIVNIIRVGIIFIIWLIKNRKGGEKNVKSSNRRTYEYSHGKHQGNG